MRWDSICVGYDNNGASYVGYNLTGCLFVVCLVVMTLELEQDWCGLRIRSEMLGS